MYVKCGTQTRTRYVSISSLVGAVGGKLCKCLIGMHGFTGCDNVSAFAGRGEITALRLVKQQKSYEEFFKQLGMEWVLSNELFQSLQEFTCKLYCSQPGTDNINEMRYRLFCAKVTSTPPSYHHMLTACSSMLLEKTSKQSFGSEVCNAALWHPRPAVLAGGKAAITLPLTGWAVTQPLQPC